MADRVWFVGGKTPGRDHFPFSVVDLSQLNDHDLSWGLFNETEALGNGDSIYPLGIDLAAALKWYWRVKSWDIIIAASFSADADDGVQSAYTVSYEGTINVPSLINFSTGVEPAREGDLVGNFLWQDPPATDVATRLGPVVGFKKTIENLTAATTAPGDHAEFDLTEFYLFVPDPANTWVPATMIDPESGLLYPAIGISMELRVNWEFTYPPPPDGSGITQGFGISSLAFSRFQVGGDPNLPGGSCAIDGTMWQLYGGDNNDNLKDQSWDVSIVPHEFWPYAARDGSPIWDTATGAQLQDPTN